MAEFIKREAVLARAKTLHEIQYGTGTRTLVDVSAVRTSDIEDILAADVVEVVRCKDCHWWTKLEECPQGRCELAGFIQPANGSARMESPSPSTKGDNDV